MYIRDIFATKIRERIEPVVKVADRSPAIVLSELSNLVVTPQWERYMGHILEEYTDTFDQEDERGIGIWISGFFGSGKSLLMKVLGLLLEGGELQGQSIHQLFLSRLPQGSAERADIERYLAVCQRKIATSLVGGNLHARQVKSSDPLPLIIFKLFAEARGYTNNWAFAWTIEYQLDLKGHTQAFRNRVSKSSSTDWTEIAQDSDVYGELLNDAVVQILPELFSSSDAVERAVNTAFQLGIDAKALIERLHRWCVTRDNIGVRHKVLLQLDELGQWIRGTNNATGKLMEVQALVETASRVGQGRIWVAVTAHGDVQELQPNVQQALYATINQRFALQCRLTNEDINAVVQERLLRKTLTGSSALREEFLQRTGELTDLGSLRGTRQIYAPPDEQSFAQYYPYFPWMVTAIPKIVKGIAQSTGRDEALTGSNRTMISMVQTSILDTQGLLDMRIGRVLCLADLYEKLSGDAPIETRTDINRITANVSKATEETANVARVLYLLGRDPNIPCMLDNIARALVTSLDDNLNELRTVVEAELERLIGAGYVKRVGDTYSFLSTQQRSFQSKIRQREAKIYEEVYELSQKLKKYDDVDALRFDLVPVRGVTGGRDKPLRIQLDNRTIRNSSSPVTVYVYSPLQRFLDPDIVHDAVLKQRSNQDPNGFILRIGEVKEFRRILARAVATAELIEEVTNKAGNDPEKKVAEQARNDLQQYEDDVRYVLAEAVRGSTVFFRGSIYPLMDGSGANNAVRNTLSYLLPDIYSRFAQLPHRIVNEEAAVKAALNEVIINDDLQKLGVYTQDGLLNETSVLISTLKGKLPQMENDQGFINADILRSELEKPPFGWDGNAVKVGLALLLRASACRLIIDGKPFTDPHSPEVLQYLTKDLRFKVLRVQGVRSELKSAELFAIRTHMETIFVFDTKLVAVAATLNNELGKQLNEMQQKEQTLREWVSTTSCPLPSAFESGCSLVSELQNNASFSTRLPLFANDWEVLDQHVQLADTLLRFKSEHGSMFVTIRDFYNSIINLDPEDLLEAVRVFKEDWLTVIKDRSVVDSTCWDGLVRAYQNAQQAITNQISQWRQEVEHDLAKIETSLKDRLLAAGIPKEQVDAEAVGLSADMQALRKRLAQPSPRYSEARSMRNALSSIRMNLPSKVREASARYLPKITYQPQELRLRWQDVMGQVRIDSQDDLEQVIATLRRCISVELELQKSITLE